ncbi:MAG: DUF4419 domain-containing protein [Bacteroidota bacterium]
MKKTTSHPNSSLTFQVEKLTRPRKLLPEIPYEEVLHGFSKDIHSTPSGPKKLVDFGGHPFLGTLYSAYADHRPIILSPDMIWLLILQGFSRHINYNTTMMAELLGFKKEKVKLKLEYPATFLEGGYEVWEEAVLDFEEELRKHVGDTFLNKLLPDFSTTGHKEYIAGMVSVMNSLKPFFTYLIEVISCGIPAISLEGTQKDWIALKAKILDLKKYELDWWLSDLEAILDQFISAFNNKVDKDFWRNMFKIHKPQMCGDPEKIDGWITHFFPYDRFGRRRAGEFIRDINDLPEEVLKVDFIFRIKYPGQAKDYPMQLISGFVGAEQKAEDFSLRPHISWMVAKADEEDKSKALPQDAFLYSYANLTEFPAEVLSIKKSFSLDLYFLDKVELPKALRKKEIHYLKVMGEISHKNKRWILRNFPFSAVQINDEYYHNLPGYGWFSRIRTALWYRIIRLLP